MIQAQEAASCAWLEVSYCRSTVEIRAYVAADLGLNHSHSGCMTQHQAPDNVTSSAGFHNQLKSIS